MSHNWEERARRCGAGGDDSRFAFSSGPSLITFSVSLERPSSRADFGPAFLRVLHRHFLLPSAVTLHASGWIEAQGARGMPRIGHGYTMTRCAGSICAYSKSLRVNPARAQRIRHSGNGGSCLVASRNSASFHRLASWIEGLLVQRILALCFASRVRALLRLLQRSFVLLFLHVLGGPGKATAIA